MAAENTIFVWTGTDRNGRKSKGEVLATTAAIARVQLRKQGIAAKSVKKKPKPLITFGAKKIQPADIAIFTRQLATMMKAGVPLVQAFDIVAEGTECADRCVVGHRIGRRAREAPPALRRAVLLIGGLG